MAEWESSLAVRDGVFMQVFILTGLVYLAYRLLPACQKIILTAGLVLFLALFAVTMVNIWEPLL